MIITWAQFLQYLAMMGLALFVLGIFVTVLHLDLLKNRVKADIERQVEEKKNRLNNL